ncbi:glycogen synthase GlgA [Noviherbaspirillum aridicola]|uniref:Glycogen synthase n=1 Tax=Noviherbaspirillum aridicola TaxID=2849687 RepID=A0ABQ4Q8X3_9BURK|nr:glycogen synthase GlgA [Noviherbaspirillum aridicola]GIZ53270.1 glycogen synthase [Noviherbaspirillum aridicola]
MNARVLIVASEAIPLIKTGGLADVITALARALRAEGIDASVMIPAYPAAVARAGKLREAARIDDLPGGPGTLLTGVIPDTDVPVVMLHNSSFERRSANPYVDTDGNEFADNAVSFAALAHAAVAICAGETTLPVPNVVHANDWHAGLIPTLLKLKGVSNVASLLTIHNLAFQGNYAMAIAQSIGIPEELLHADGLEFWGRLSYLKGGLLHADRISTVSQSYAEEILTPRFGHGMEGILNARREDLRAIPNGVDTNFWNPTADSLIARTFERDDMRGKSACKRELQQLFGLPHEPFAPLLAIGSRITHQKMADVALRALPNVLEKFPRAQVIILGCGERSYEDGFLGLAEAFPGRVAAHIGYDERRAHALHAGADMLLHGTRFEPFGLTPLYSMRYGTVPIASRVGGMIDSIVDAGADGPLAPGARGILFDGEEPEDMVRAIARAFELYARPVDWHAMQREAMSADFSWEGPARRYISVYSEISPAFSTRETPRAPAAEVVPAPLYLTA